MVNTKPSRKPPLAAKKEVELSEKEEFSIWVGVDRKYKKREGIASNIAPGGMGTKGVTYLNAGNLDKLLGLKK